MLRRKTKHGKEKRGSEGLGRPSPNSACSALGVCRISVLSQTLERTYMSVILPGAHIKLSKVSHSSPFPWAGRGIPSP